MSSLVIESYNSAVEVKSEKDYIIEELRKPENRKILERMIPSVNVKESSASEVLPSISITEGDKFEVKEGYPNSEVKGKNLYYTDIASLAEYMLERERQEKGIYNLHSSTVGLEGRCIVINGASKSGKTLLSLNAAEYYGLKFLTNERALIDLKSSSLVGGCKSLDLSEYHRKSFERLSKQRDLELMEVSSSYPIAAIIQPVIDSGTDSFATTLIAPREAEWSLYPEFTCRIRGDNKRLFGDSREYLTYPLDSFDTKELARQRMGDLRTFLDKIPVYFIRGSLNDICSFIKGKLE